MLSLSGCLIENDVFNSVFAPSLVACAAACSLSPTTCVAFITDGGTCKRMTSCPVKCNKTSDNQRKWNVYCPKRK